MKKLLVVLVVLGAGAYGIYMLTAGRAPEKVACARYAELCGGQNPAREVAACEGFFADVRKVGGGSAVEQPAQCLTEAQSCGAAVGCMSGAVGKAGVNFGSEFLKGLNESLKK